MRPSSGRWISPSLPPNGRCDVQPKRDYRRVSRGLRFRLTTSYAVLFTILLIMVALLFRQRLHSALDQQIEEELNQEWAAMKGYMRIEPNQEKGGKYNASWYYDIEDPDETTIVLDIKKIYLITDRNGIPIPEYSTQEPAYSTGYDDVGLDKPAEIAKWVREALASPKPKTLWMERKASNGDPIRIRAGLVYAERHGPPFYVAIGATYAHNVKVMHDFAWFLAGVIPGALVL